MVNLPTTTLSVAAIQVTVELAKDYIQSQRKNEKIQEAEKALENGNYERAEDLLDEAQADSSVENLVDYVKRKAIAIVDSSVNSVQSLTDRVFTLENGEEWPYENDCVYCSSECAYRYDIYTN